jgi:hypothetical protein
MSQTLTPIQRNRRDRIAASIFWSLAPLNLAESLQIRAGCCRFLWYMWCSTCHQDVPIVPHEATGRKVCARCQRPLRVRKPPHASAICDGGLPLDEPAAATAAATLPRVDDWSVRQRLRQLDRELRRSALATSTGVNSFPQGPRRFDPPQLNLDQLAQAVVPSFTPAVAASSISRSRRTERGQILIWLIVFVGVVILAGGAGLVAWSLSTRQMIYWNLAIGLTLGGQGLLIFGLVLAVSRLWRNSRYASGKLQDVHARLSQLQHTAESITATRSAGAPAFYAELVRSASPQVLAANLKGQIDQLATRIGSGV